jgi:minor extracellular serine protease Vpr
VQAGLFGRTASLRRGLTVVVVGALVTASAGAGGAAPAGADPGRTHTFRPAPAGLTVRYTPPGVRNAPVTVVAEVSGDPVAVAEADAAQPLTATQKQQRKDQLKQQQAPVVDQVRALGGTVLGAYQSAYNGIKVRIPATKVPALSDVPGVVAVHSVTPMKPDNTRGVPLIGAPAVWDGLAGLHGEHIKIAVIDTGIDYTHADFGGPGTPQAYTAAHAAETAPADPAFFGPAAPKVKGGVDLVGDSYNADPNSPDYQPVPHPDPNPLDCYGHGSHVAGTAAGFGVLADGTTYHGPYNADTIASHQWSVGPGVAPKADLYAVRVFGCAGSTDVTVDAIDWAVDHDMNVINMSLGSPFGSGDDPSAVAADNAARAGVIVVTSAGNEGSAPYMAGSPGTGTGVISTAALDPVPGFPGASVALAGGPTLNAINANGAIFSDGLTLPVTVLRTPTGQISLGCDPAEYTNAGVAGKLVVTARGTCARVARAIFGQKAGAAAVLMVNNADSLPPFEGRITSNPDTGEQYTVTIPFLGVPSSAGAALLAADGKTATLNNINLPNPGYLAPASFTSGGPRTGDSWLKPDVTAPGVSISSVGIGTGNGPAVMSGTSMASPHTAGTAALVKQAHPNWRRTEYWKAAVVNTADPGKMQGYSTRLSGAGLIQAPAATTTQVVALGDRGTATLNYGFAELGRDLHQTKTVRLRNFGSAPVTFTVGTALPAGSPHTVKPKKSKVTVPGRGEAEVAVELTVPAKTAGDSSAFRDVAGQITFTPTGAGNHGIRLRVPYYLVPQAVSNVDTRIDVDKLRRTGSATATTTNRNGVVAGSADWYAWGLSDGRDRGLGSNDVRAVGAQAFPGVIAFAVNTEHRWSNAAANEYDIFADVNGDGTDDYVVVGADLGLLTTGEASGQLVSAVFDLRTNASSIEFFADAPTDSTTLVLPAQISQLCATGSPCLSPTSPRLKYHAQAVSTSDGSVDTVDGTAIFNAFTPAISTGMFDTVAPNATATETVTINRDEWAKSTPLGLMIVSHDNRADDEAQLVPVRLSGPRS